MRTDDENSAATIATRDRDRKADDAAAGILLAASLWLAMYVAFTLRFNPWMGPMLWLLAAVGWAILIPLVLHRQLRAARKTRYVLGETSLLLEANGRGRSVFELAELRQIEIARKRYGARQLVLSDKMGDSVRIGPVRDADSFAADIESAAKSAGARFSVVRDG